MHGVDYFVYSSCVFFYYLHLASVFTMFMVNKASCVFIGGKARNMPKVLKLCTEEVYILHVSSFKYFFA